MPSEKNHLRDSLGILCAPLASMPEFSELIGGLTRDLGPYSIHELSDSQKAHFTAALEYMTGRRIIFIAHNDFSAQKVFEDLNALYGNDALFIPSREIMFYDVEARDYDIAFRRVRAFDRLLTCDYSAAVISADAAAQFAPPPELFERMTLRYAAGELLDPQETSETFAKMGYERVAAVEARGAFAVRGGILDVYPVNHEYAVRIELFDDEIESIRLFDVQTQRTVGKVDGEIKILPARDILYDSSDLPDIFNRIQSSAPDKHMAAVEEDIERFKAFHYFAGMDRYLAFIYEGVDTPLSYARDCLFILDEPARVFQKLEASAVEYSEIGAALIAKGKLLPNAPVVQLDFYELMKKIRTSRMISLSATRTARETELLGSLKSRVIPGRAAISYQGNVELLKTDIRERLRDNWMVLLLTNSAVKAERLSETLAAERIPVQRAEHEQDIRRGMVNICYGALSSGFEYLKLKLIIICDSEFHSGVRGSKRTRKPRQGEKINFFTDLRTGDFVVHQAHGIGVFSGIEQMKIDGAARDYLKIRYKDGDILYIPTNQLDLVQKYVGSDARSPKINSLNSTEWFKTKRRVKESLRTLASELILIYAKRRDSRGFAFSPDTVWQQQFEEQFPYPETDDQLRSIDEIKADMESPRLMDRLLCGDVGFGKTEVAIRAAFKAVTDGKQVAFLVPTTVLAQQHHQTFTERFRDFPISIDVLSRFRTAKEQKQITDALSVGMLDIVVGTHKLLNKNIVFKNLGLLVVDEEQRFGVNQKERIKALKPDIDVLSLSATPIPRTLHMSMTKIRDISVLKDPPEDRFPVQTFVMEYDEDVIREAILREAARGGQVFYLYNRVMGIDIKAMQLRAMLPESIRVACAHGQMNNRELEDIMLDFINRRYDVLLCTTIIESGLDIPNVNTIVVEDADHMGLAQLYQLRGRVGRSNRLAYAYITHKRDKVISEESEKRLSAIREFTELGSGFRIAMRDMEIRGVGNLLGVEQHGHMESVGYDMYCRLLDEAVRELEREGKSRTDAAGAASAAASMGSAAAASTDTIRSGGAAAMAATSTSAGTIRSGGAAAATIRSGGAAVATATAAATSAGTIRSHSAAGYDSGIDQVAQVSLDIHINAYIDSLYIDDEALRLEMYQKIAAARSEDDIGDIIDEMTDRYSLMPLETENLINLARMKILAAGCGISSIAEKDGQAIMQINPGGKFNLEKLPAILNSYKSRVLFSAGAAPYISLKTRPATEQSLAYIKNAQLNAAIENSPRKNPAYTGIQRQTSPYNAIPRQNPASRVSAASPERRGDIVADILRFLGDMNKPELSPN